MKQMVGSIIVKDNEQYFSPSYIYDYPLIKMPMKVKVGDGIITLNKKGKVKHYRNLEPRKLKLSKIKKIYEEVDQELKRLGVID